MSDLNHQCGYCNDTWKIDDWRTYCQAWRMAREYSGHEWMYKVCRAEILQACREIRDGWTGKVSGYKHKHQDCPCCSY